MHASSDSIKNEDAIEGSLKDSPIKFLIAFKHRRKVRFGNNQQPKFLTPPSVFVDFRFLAADCFSYSDCTCSRRPAFRRAPMAWTITAAVNPNASDTTSEHN